MNINIHRMLKCQLHFPAFLVVLNPCLSFSSFHRLFFVCYFLQIFAQLLKCPHGRARELKTGYTPLNKVQNQQNQSACGYCFIHTSKDKLKKKKKFAGGRIYLDLVTYESKWIRDPKIDWVNVLTDRLWNFMLYLLIDIDSWLSCLFLLMKHVHFIP